MGGSGADGVYALLRILWIFFFFFFHKIRYLFNIQLRRPAGVVYFYSTIKWTIFFLTGCSCCAHVKYNIVIREIVLIYFILYSWPVLFFK